MAASHPAAKLAASSLQTPVNPSTGAQVTQYEREEPLEALGAEAVEEEKDEEEEKAVRPARARVMRGREVAGAGRPPGAGGGWLAFRQGEGQAGKRGALSSSSLHSKSGPPPSFCPPPPRKIN